MSTTFANTASPTPFAIFDADTTFKTDADKMVTFVKRKLGDDIVSVELTKKQIWACFEEATLEYGSIVNEFQAQSQLMTLMGMPTGTDRQDKLPRENLEFIMRKAEPYAMEAGFRGSYNTVTGSITLIKDQQDYDIYNELKNAAGSLIFSSSMNTTPRTRLKIIEVFHFSPQSAYRFFDTTSAINYLNNEFSFESFTPETVFYVLPVFEDVLRAGQLSLSGQVRRSNYTYRISGTKIRLFPKPTQDDPKKLWLRVGFYPDPFDPAYQDETIDGVSNLSNVPFNNLTYSRINSIGKQWVRQYCLALSQELLGHVRSKFSSVPIPGGEVTLDGAALIDQARADREKLSEKLRETLNTLTYESLLKRAADESDALNKILSKIPMPMGIAISVG